MLEVGVNHFFNQKKCQLKSKEQIPNSKTKVLATDQFPLRNVLNNYKLYHFNNHYFSGVCVG